MSGAGGLKHYSTKGGHLNGNSCPMYPPPRSISVSRAGMGGEALSSWSVAPGTHLVYSAHPSALQSCAMQASGTSEVGLLFFCFVYVELKLTREIQEVMDDCY